MYKRQGLEFPIVAVADFASPALPPGKLVVETCGAAAHASLAAGGSLDAFPGVAKRAGAGGFEDEEDADLAAARRVLEGAPACDGRGAPACTLSLIHISIGGCGRAALSLSMPPSYRNAPACGRFPGPPAPGFTERVEPFRRRIARWLRIRDGRRTGRCAPGRPVNWSLAALRRTGTRKAPPCAGSAISAWRFDA